MCVDCPPPLNVAFHAQVSSKSSGFVVGSEVTCQGMQQAFLSRVKTTCRGPSANTTSLAIAKHSHIFYPFEYNAELVTRWDLVIIEGWFMMVDSFIHEIRRLSPCAVIVYFCLDPDLPGLERLALLDVDAFITNSEFAASNLARLSGLPTENVLIAVDDRKFKPICKEMEISEECQPLPSCEGNNFPTSSVST
jgi:hypothetical protein